MFQTAGVTVVTLQTCPSGVGVLPWFNYILLVPVNQYFYCGISNFKIIKEFWLTFSSPCFPIWCYLFRKHLKMTVKMILYALYKMYKILIKRSVIKRCNIPLKSNCWFMNSYHCVVWAKCQMTFLRQHNLGLRTRQSSTRNLLHGRQKSSNRTTLTLWFWLSLEI